MDKTVSRTEAAKLLKARFLDALMCNDSEEVWRIVHTTNIDIDTVFEVKDPSMILASYKQGYWLPGYKLESSWATGLHVCMMYDAVESAVVLLESGAAVNRKPNGKTPLHVACEVSHGASVALLLDHGARVNGVSLSGHCPLHYCITHESVECAKQLILKGATVNAASENSDEDTPLHTAARFGIPGLASLYVSNGADVNAVNAHGETPLIVAAFWAMCPRERTYSTDHHLVCRILLDAGADPQLQEEDKKSALHKAGWSCDHTLMRMLLEAGADARQMDINGCAPIQYVLKATGMRPMALPQLCYQMLLNFGAARIYPPQFHKVLQSCYDYPSAVEVMVNSYEHIKSTRKWRSAIPDISYKQHSDFYDSLFAVCSNSPRTLLHLSRCAVRAALGRRCDSCVQVLPLPARMQRYLLLEPEGIIY